MDSKVVVYNARPHEPLMLRFLLARAQVEAITFCHEGELENWLHHCVDVTSSICGIIIDCVTYHERDFHFSFSDVLSSKKIPLIIITIEPVSRDWCCPQSRGGISIYHVSLDQLPQLLNHLRGDGSQ